MTGFVRCPQCGEWYWTAYSHRCKPLWDVWAKDYHDEDDPVMVRAMHAEDAAEKWAEESDRDSCEYDIASGSAAVVNVRPHGSDKPWQTFEVTGEEVPHYTVRLVRANAGVSL